MHFSAANAIPRAVAIQNTSRNQFLKNVTHLAQSFRIATKYITILTIVDLDGMMENFFIRITSRTSISYSCNSKGELRSVLR